MAPRSASPLASERGAAAVTPVIANCSSRRFMISHTVALCIYSDLVLIHGLDFLQQRFLHHHSQLGDRRRLEEGTDRYLDLKGAAHSRGKLGCQQRVQPEL